MTADSTSSSGPGPPAPSPGLPPSPASPAGHSLTPCRPSPTSSATPRHRPRRPLPACRRHRHHQQGTRSRPAGLRLLRRRPRGTGPGDHSLPAVPGRQRHPPAGPRPLASAPADLPPPPALAAWPRPAPARPIALPGHHRRPAPGPAPAAPLHTPAADLRARNRSRAHHRPCARSPVRELPAARHPAPGRKHPPRQHTASPGPAHQRSDLPRRHRTRGLASRRDAALTQGPRTPVSKAARPQPRGPGQARRLNAKSGANRTPGRGERAETLLQQSHSIRPTQVRVLRWADLRETGQQGRQPSIEHLHGESSGSPSRPINSTFPDPRETLGIQACAARNDGSGTARPAAFAASSQAATACSTSVTASCGVGPCAAQHSTAQHSTEGRARLRSTPRPRGSSTPEWGMPSLLFLQLQIYPRTSAGGRPISLLPGGSRNGRRCGSSTLEHQRRPRRARDSVGAGLYGHRV